MYWRVRKAGLDQYVRQYGVHALLGFSLVMNVLQFATRPSPKTTVSKEMKADFDVFGRSVTTHLLDTSYISYRRSTLALTSELAPPVQQILAKAGMLAISADDLAAQEKSLTDSRQLSAIRIDDLVVGEPNERGFIPVDVRGVVAIHSSDEHGTAEPQPFRFKYWVGTRSDKQGKPILENNKPLPAVAQFDDLSGKSDAPQ